MGKNLGKKMTAPLLYKPAKIYSAGGDLKATWYVYFSWRINLNARFIRKRITGGINRFEQAETRMVAAEILQRLVNEALEGGYDPEVLPETELHTNTNIIAAIKDVIQVKRGHIKKKSGSSYTSHANKFFAWLRLKGYENMQAPDFKPVHISHYLQYLTKENYHPVTINNNMASLNRFFVKLHKLRIIPDNPFTSYDKLKEPESDFYKIFTHDELTAIFTNLKSNYPGLYLFTLFIYYCFMRNGSIRMIQASDIDFESRTVKVLGENHKTGKTTVKQLLEPVYNALIEAGADKLPGEWFLFGKNLRPSPKTCGTNTPGNLWKVVVMEKMGIDKRMYGLKHTGGTHYKQDNRGNEDLAWLQQQMGHSSLAETEAYIHKAGFIRLDEKKAKIRKY
jgi:integrase